MDSYGDSYGHESYAHASIYGDSPFNHMPNPMGMAQSKAQSKYYAYNYDYGYSYWVPEIDGRDYQLMETFCEYLMNQVWNELTYNQNQTGYFVVKPNFDSYSVCGRILGDENLAYNYESWVTYSIGQPNCTNETAEEDSYYYDDSYYSYSDDSYYGYYDDSYYGYSYDYFVNNPNCSANTLQSSYEYSLQWYIDNYGPEYRQYFSGYENFFTDRGLDYCDYNSFYVAYDAMDNEPDFFCKYWGEEYCYSGDYYAQMRAQAKPQDSKRFLAQTRTLAQKGRRAI